MDFVNLNRKHSKTNHVNCKVKVKSLSLKSVKSETSMSRSWKRGTCDMSMFCSLSHWPCNLKPGHSYLPSRGKVLVYPSAPVGVGFLSWIWSFCSAYTQSVGCKSRSWFCHVCDTLTCWYSGIHTGIIFSHRQRTASSSETVTPCSHSHWPFGLAVSCLHLFIIYL